VERAIVERVVRQMGWLRRREGGHGLGAQMRRAEVEAGSRPGGTR
jgi:hypothetical protein